MQINLHVRNVCFSSHMGTIHTHPAFVHHVSGTIACARCDPASVTYAARVHDLAAVCHAVASRASRPVASAHTARIRHISSAVALAGGDARSAAHLFICVFQEERGNKTRKMIPDFLPICSRPNQRSRIVNTKGFVHRFAWSHKGLYITFERS